MTMQQFYDNCRPKSAAVNFNREPKTTAAAASLVQTDNKNTFSPREAKMQASTKWRNSINIPDDYTAQCDDFIYILEPFKSMSDRHLRHIKTGPPRKSWFGPAATKPMHSVPYPTGPKASSFEKNVIDNMSLMNVIEPAQTKSVSLVAFAQRWT